MSIFPSQRRRAFREMARRRRRQCQPTRRTSAGELGADEHRAVEKHPQAGKRETISIKKT